MGRFNSREELEWAKGPFDDGAEARIFGYGRDQCPGEDSIGPFAVKSWKAGWADADASIAADLEAGSPDAEVFRDSSRP